jgi:hypothetical protein
VEHAGKVAAVGDADGVGYLCDVQPSFAEELAGLADAEAVEVVDGG